MTTKSAISTLQILCIDIEPSSVAYILTKPEAENFALDTCRSLLDAQKKIASTSYDVYIIDMSLLEASAFTFLHEIRKKGPSTIAVILDSLPEESDLRMLKEDKKIDFIIEKRNVQQRIDLMIKEILESKRVKAETHKNRMLEFKQQYDASIPEKIALLTELTRSAQQNPELIKELKGALHKIGGSAKSYGYENVGVLCKAMETEINANIASGKYKDPQWLTSLDDFIKRIKEGYQTSSVNESSPASPAKLPSIANPVLFVVDDDVHFLELLERVKAGFPIDLVVEFDPQKAIERLRSDFTPYCILVSQKFRTSSLTGLDILAQAKKKPSPLAVILLEKDLIDVRLDATQKGCDYVFCKPVSAYVLLKSIAKAMEVKPLDSYKVLVVDDDTDFCNFVIANLTDIGITINTISEPSEIFNKLEVFKPDILLLDISLSFKYDGLQLLKSIRQDMAYRNLTIVIITSGEQIETKIKAYVANADDILFKPIDQKFLQKRILSIIDRKTSTKDPIDDYTGLPHLEELMEALNDSIKKSTSSKSHLVLFEVNKLGEMNKQKGYLFTKEIMILVVNKLLWESDDKMKCFVYNTSTFAIIFEGSHIKVIENKIFTFLNRLVQAEQRWPISFNCCIVPLSKNFVNASKILQAAEESLSEAATKEASSVKIVQRLQGEGDDKQELVIIDPSRDLLNIMKHAFEGHGLVVHTYCEGGEALKDLLAYSENRLPSLIIMERNLPDMDGMNLYFKLKTRFRTTIPFFILTVFSSDKDISDGIKQGIQEYIVKPFNISFLVKKALQVVHKT